MKKIALISLCITLLALPVMAAESVYGKEILQITAYDGFVVITFSPSHPGPCEHKNYFYVDTKDGLGKDMMTSIYLARSLGEKINFRFSVCEKPSPYWQTTPKAYRVRF